MPDQIAPWLEDLDEDWVEPVPVAKTAAAFQPSSMTSPVPGPTSPSGSEASQSRVKSTSTRPSRIPRRSSGAYSVASTSDPAPGSLRRRAPFTEISNNTPGFASPTHSVSRKARPVSPSESCASAGSVVRYDTVARKSKSNSPEKQEPQEWKKRLIDGELGYGDQTDLFAPSGLENIFQSPSRPTTANSSQPPLQSFRKLFTPQMIPPSSPPPYPSTIDGSRNSSVLSPAQLPADQHLLQPSSCKQAANRTISGQTDYSGEGFSPVFISKHTTVDGRVDYAAVDHDVSENMLDESNVSLPPPADPDQSGFSSDRDDRTFDDNSEMPTVPDVSLPDNLPTGTPPPVQRSATPLERDESSMLSPSLSPPKTRPSTSPLKLFGNYDTFTNNRLLRRMSQLEDLDREGMMDSAVETESRNGARSYTASPDNPGSPAIMSGRASRSSYLARRSHHSQPREGSQSTQRQIMPSLSSFGEGELDDHDFEADLSIPTALDLSEQDFYENSPPPDIAPPGSRQPFRFHLDEMEARSSLKLKRKLSKRSTARSRLSADYSSIQQTFPAATGERGESVEGKRPRTSPSKAPTPKRRRTIVALSGAMPGLGHGSEIQVKITGASTDGSRSASYEDAGSWRRMKDSLSRPRNPTPGQSRENNARDRDSHVHHEIDEATMHFLDSSPRLEAVKEKLDLTDIPEESLTAEQAQSVAAEVAAFTLQMSKSEIEGKRSRSITTQDFLDEAMHIMSLIRARGRPHSGLGNLEESEAEEALGETLLPKNVAPRSPSPLRLSRPPSREGGNSGWRPRSRTQQDPRVASRLRKFQESDDELDLVESSLRSLNMGALENHADQDALADTLSNIRIRGPRPETRRPRGESDVSHKSKASKTHGSNPSLDSSSSRTIGTHSTRKSDNVATLAPENVAHLIPEEIGGMTFDREKQKWVRIKSAKRVHREIPVSPEHPSNITSEDDPFNDIPDLTVDEMKEMNRISRSNSNGRSTHDQAHHPQAPPSRQGTRQKLSESAAPRPVTRENQAPPPFNSSSAPSKYSVFGSSKQFGSSQQQPQIDTRATSWSNEELANLNRGKTQTGHGLLDLAHANMPHPISDIPEHVDEDSEPSEDDSLQSGESVTEEIPAPKQRQRTSWIASSSGSANNPGPRPMSLRRQTLNRGLHTTTQDQSELSFVATLPDKRLMSVSVNLSQPSAKRAAPSQDLVVPSSTPARIDGTFYLSDLPDFTMNDEDPERPSEKMLAKRVAQHTSTDRYGMAVQSLVKTLTDVEPDEPYWEDIKKLSLRERDLGSVHNLEDFCSRLEDLDLSNNNIAHLEGAPISIRRLNVRSNALSSLTAWSHLMNLQYLDISSNSIDSLAGLSMLIHLREVRADDNQISSLDGVMGLDGLLKLSVRCNNIDNVDFEGSELKRLEEVDLSGNQLTTFTQAESLPSLFRLNLDDNELQTFASNTPASKLAFLSVQSNQLTSFDVSNLAALRYLNVDENRLSTVDGLDRLHALDTLSMRRQHTTKLSIFEQVLHTRSLNLSSNAIGHLDLQHSFHSIQNLELACCGLQELPADFGLKMPNLRAINLSFNALKDVRPLLNITRLETLNVAGNRISRLRKTLATLSRMQHLRTFDARENPITLGFYPPTTTAAALKATSNEQSLVLTSGLNSSLEIRSEAHIQSSAAKSYSLPQADRVADAEHCDRLDEDAKLTRRVYELMLSQSCRALDSVDGLPYDKSKIARRDHVWDRLLDLGVMKRSSEKRDGPGGGEEPKRDGRDTPTCELEV
ncbi:hypothetical protein AAFC00_006883 [Neodothiora populina]|uniref:Septation initiation network scaffold protein cdc11 n=1 Tax=Neodothiora populina TaxID=2781224 RepID=A0ABR3PBH4_9PEZI